MIVTARLRWVGASLAVLALVVSGCARAPEQAAVRSSPEATTAAESAEPAQTAAPAGPSGSFPSARAEQLDGAGRFYLVMGAEGKLTYLYVMDWGTLEPKPVAPKAVVTNVSACGDVVVATTTTREGETVAANRLGRVTDSGIEPIEGIGQTTGSPIAPDAQCRFAFVVRSFDGYVVRAWDPRSGQTSDVYVSSRPAGRVEWYGDSLLVRVGTSANDWRIVAVDDGEARDLDVELGPGEAFRAHPSGWLAIADPLKDPLVTRLQHLGDGRRLEVRGWTPVTWLPDGTDMLVRDEDTLAVLSVPSLRLEEVGAWTHDPIWSGTWAP